jgi:hypothetical protein
MAMARYLGIASALAATSLAQFTPEYVIDG